MASPEFSRRFVAADVVLDTWERIEPYFDQLRDRVLDDVAAVERWLEDGSELLACIDEVGTDRYIRMTCQTDDEERKAAYLDFVENLEPRCKPRVHELDVKFTQSPAAGKLSPERYAVLERGVRARVELFRPENVPLQTEEAKLAQQYQEVIGAMTVEFEGQELALPQLAPYAERTDRGLRQRAWETEAARRLEDKQRIEDIFDEMIKLRARMAQNAGCGDYRAYAFKEKQRFDYTPADCVAFHDAVERAAVPVLREMQRQRQAALGIEPLRPWDLAVDVKGRAPLKPFETAEELAAKAQKIFRRVHPEFGTWFAQMRERSYLDLASRKGKAPGGYQSTYEVARHPFIFMNAVGVQDDVTTLVHEGGHSFHTYAARQEPLLAYRSSPIEFAEVASFGMELLGLDCLDEFYTAEELARARRKQLERVVCLFPWVATIDAFQHFIYTNPKHTRAQRREHWLKLHARFGGLADWTGFEETRACLWHRQLHLFEVPFYYIEYGIAKLGALQVWRHAQRDRADAIEHYRRALALGGSKPLPELFQAAGAKFDFSYDTLAPLMETVQAELERLPV